MNQRQKIIAIAIAVPALALVAYAATSENATPVAAVAPTPTVAPPAPALAATAPATTPDAGKVPANGPKGNHQKKEITLAAAKEHFTKVLARANTMTAEQYATMRENHPKLPPTLETYRENVKKNSDRVNAMTDADFQAMQAKRAAARSTKQHAPGTKGAVRGVKVQEATKTPSDNVPSTPAAPPVAAQAPIAVQ